MNKLSRRVSIFLPNLRGGGAERAMLKLSGGIAGRGYAVDLVLARAEGIYLDEIPRSVRLVDLHASRTSTSIPALVQYLRRERPAALLSGLHANVIAICARRVAGIPTRVVVSERNALSLRVQHYAAHIRMRLTPWMIRWFYPRADFIVAVSKGVAQELSRITRLTNGRIRVIYNPIVTPELREKAQIRPDHPWFRVGQPPVILAVGRLTVQKDFATLITAFSLVRKHRQARLLILGEGEERKALQALAEQLGVEKDVSLPGFVLDPYPYMSQASLFVLSSRWEGLPGVLIEAMFCGAPLVSTDCPSGPREILQDGRYGELVPVGDVNSLTLAMENALEGKIPHPTEESWKPFALDTVVDQYIGILLEYPF
ncbi:MAG: glycosyltransferase [Desulfobacterales bacterium]|nr:glycosyltransferase [Desulfobacterales bacterium]